MFRFVLHGARLLLYAGAILSSIVAAEAQVAIDPAEALAGKTIRWIIASGPNSNTDNLARGLIEGMKAALPRTTILAQNIPTSAVALAEAETAGGEAIVLVTAHVTSIYGQMLGTELSPTDLSRFQWIGALTNNERIVGVRSALGASTVGDLAVLGRTLMTPTRGAGNPGAIESRLLAEILGLDLNLVADVDDDLTNVLFLAGDADFVINSYRTLKPLIDAGALAPVLRLGEEGYPPELEAVPTLASAVPEGTSPEIVEIIDSLNRLGRLVMATPTADPAAVEAIRAAFEQVVASEALAVYYNDHGLILAPTPAAEVEERMDFLLGDPRSASVLRSYLE